MSDLAKFAAIELSFWQNMKKAWRIDQLDHDPKSFKFNNHIFIDKRI
jgi:hypothetical protein